MALLTACGGGDGNGMACTAEARSSAMVRVVDAAGAPLVGAMVTYPVDRGPVLAAQCIGQPAACESFIAGYEVPVARRLPP